MVGGEKLPSAGKTSVSGGAADEHSSCQKGGRGAGRAAPRKMWEHRGTSGKGKSSVILTSMKASLWVWAFTQ